MNFCRRVLTKLCFLDNEDVSEYPCAWLWKFTVELSTNESKSAKHNTDLTYTFSYEFNSEGEKTENFTENSALVGWFPGYVIVYIFIVAVIGLAGIALIVGISCGLSYWLCPACCAQCCSINCPKCCNDCCPMQDSMPVLEEAEIEVRDEELMYAESQQQRATGSASQRTTLSSNDKPPNYDDLSFSTSIQNHEYGKDATTVTTF